MVRKNVQILDSRKQVKEKRTEIAEAVMSELTAYLSDTPFVAVSGVVGNIDYPKIVTKAVEKNWPPINYWMKKKRNEQLQKRMPK